MNKISTEPEHIPSEGMSCNPNCCRMTGKNVLLQQAERLRQQADNLERLASEIGELSQEADEALWELAQCFRHH